MGTPPEFQRVIIHTVTKYRHKQHTLLATDDNPLSIALQDQFTLGWTSFVEAIKWNNYVSTFLPSNKSPNPWLRELILKLWDILWMMWDHCCKILHTKRLIQQGPQLDSN